MKIAKGMMHKTDLSLSLPEKLKLIEGIERMQKVRWQRIKAFHNMVGTILSLRHFFMRNDIALMRRQKQRLLELKKHVLQ